MSWNSASTPPISRPTASRPSNGGDPRIGECRTISGASRATAAAWSRRPIVGREAVDQVLEVPDVSDVGLDEEAVLPGDPVALDDLGARPRHLGHLRQLTRARAHAHDRGQREPQRYGVDV